MSNVRPAPACLVEAGRRCLQLIASIKYGMAIAMLLLISMMGGCIPYSCEKIKIKNLDGISAAMEKIEMKLEQLGYLRTTIHSIAQGKEVDSLEEGGKINKLFAADRFRVHVELDNGQHNGEVALCEPTNEFSLEAKQRLSFPRKIVFQGARKIS